jgi:dienelactone hydrolase
VVVLLHPCDGISPFVQDWAAWFVAHGYSALIVDSFTPRRVMTLCGRPGSPDEVVKESTADESLGAADSFLLPGRGFEQLPSQRRATLIRFGRLVRHQNTDDQLIHSLDAQERGFDALGALTWLRTWTANGSARSAGRRAGVRRWRPT